MIMRMKVTNMILTGETMTGWIVLIPIVYLIWIVVKSEEGKSDNN